jgi:hypothetical protein
VALIALAATILARPSWRVLAKLRPLIRHGMTLIALSVLIKAGPLLISTTDTPKLVRLADGVNQGILFVLIVLSIATVVQAMLEVVRLASRWQE